MALYIALLILSSTVTVNSVYHVQAPFKEECSCSCSATSSDDSTVCQKLYRFDTELTAVKDAIRHRTQYINVIKDLEEKLDVQEYYVSKLTKEVELLKSIVENKPTLPTPQALVMKPEDQMLNDGIGGSAHLVEENGELLKNVSNLIAKVEVVENLTMEVQEELKSERRVRRHLEEDINETRSSVQVLGDRFMNFSKPVNSRISHVEEIVITTLENLNKTLFEDHLQKLYYKIDGVAYQNETKKLDERLENIETELVLENNTSSILSEELKNLTEVLYNLNATLTEKIIADESRLEAIENKTNKLADLESLDDEIGVLLNTSNLIQSGVNDLWDDIQDVRNFALTTQHELEWRMSYIENSTTPVEQEQIKHLLDELSTLKANFSETLESLRNIRKEIDVLTAFEIANENKIYDLKSKLNTTFKEIETKLSNISETCISSLNTTHQEMEEYEKLLNNTSKRFEELVENHPESNLNQIASSNYDYDLDEEITVFGNKDKKLCSLPDLDDEHLRFAMETDEYGDQKLVFFCLPIGQYALNGSHTSVRCHHGKWKSHFPMCVRLHTESEVTTISNLLSVTSPCVSAQFAPKFPDPSDCTRYFRCWNGKTERMRCPRNQHFSSVQKKCVAEANANCSPFETVETKQLREIIPTIIIEPNTVDKANGFLGTGNTGQLVVYPRTNLKLHCLYPKSIWGNPEWWYSSLNTSGFTNLISQASENFITTTINAPGHDNSGIYTCRTPFGKTHSISVVVEAVTCPPIEPSPTEVYEVDYVSHPEAPVRAMTTKAVFYCKGRKVYHALCQANGTWSKQPPTEKECSLTNGQFWGCPAIETEKEPDLILDIFNEEHTVLFKCLGRTRLVGSPQTRCDVENHEWTHSRLPKCLPVS